MIFFKQKTAYDMRISDWSSDVCSSETCMTLGMLSDEQAARLAHAGLDYYNHNVDTSLEYYGEVITTRTYQERLDTLDRVRAAGMSVCAGGLVGIGESREDCIGFLHTLATPNGKAHARTPVTN